MKRQFRATIVPCTAGYQFGYVGRWGKYQVWDKTRAGVIKQLLEIIFIKN